MAEILIKAIDATHSDPVKDKAGCYKRGMPVVIMPDGHPWGKEERPPLFCVLKFPVIGVKRLEEYISEHRLAVDVTQSLYQRRVWQLQWASLPAAARTKLQKTGVLTIKATAAYTGPYDYTWAQMKQYIKNLDTGLFETRELA